MSLSKKPERVEALALIMALTLLVYTLAERKLRQALEQTQQTVLDQRKRPDRQADISMDSSEVSGCPFGDAQWSTANDQSLRGKAIDCSTARAALPSYRYYLLVDSPPTCGM